MENENINAKFIDLIKQWNICYSIFSKITKDELSLKVKDIEHQLNKHNYDNILNSVSDLGGVLEKVHNHLQDLGSIYNQMWSAVNNNID